MMEKVKLKTVKLLQWFSNFSAGIASERILKNHICPLTFLSCHLTFIKLNSK